MTKVSVDSTLRARLHDLDEVLELCDESGQTLGYFHPVVHVSSSQKATDLSPFSEEEIRRRQQDRTGRSLGEILEDLNVSHPSSVPLQSMPVGQRGGCEERGPRCR